MDDPGDHLKFMPGHRTVVHAIEDWQQDFVVFPGHRVVMADIQSWISLQLEAHERAL